MSVRRVQMSRRRPWRADHPDAVIVARPTKWGNPFRVDPTASSSTAAREQAVDAFRDWLERRRTGALTADEAQIRYPSEAEIRAELAGRDLACWCPIPEPGQPDHCHATVLMGIANERSLP